MNNKLSGIFKNLCPRCHTGKVFSGVYQMNSKCPHCGVSFDREDGYYMGAMVLGYIIGALSMIPTATVCMFVFKLEFFWVATIPCIQVALINPFIFYFGRMIWIYFDQTEDPA